MSLPIIKSSDYVFLDSAYPLKKESRSYFFDKPKKYIIALSLYDVEKSLNEIQKLSKKYWLAGYLRYESAFAFLPVKLRGKFNADPLKPLVWFGVYDRPKSVNVSADEAPVYVPSIVIKPQISYVNYCKAIAFIKGQIKKGNTYQVNYTFDLLVQAGCSVENLYFHLRQFQKTPYCALIKNSYEQILSFSPELFFQRDDQEILTRPMKGTAARGKTASIDSQNREGLKKDVKNRAENLMIVDLLRNDLGRICKPGTVKTPSMFDVETHPTLHQMTSLIQGELLKDVSYPDIFKSLFPCGSVTGAPKINTMKIIQCLEKGARGVYCGAIGYISPKKKAVFSVPIRILQKPHGSQNWQYRVGGGIVWDSSAEGEWEEARVKASFLSMQSLPNFSILETMLWNGENIIFKKEHLARMKKSAKIFNFPVTHESLNKYFSKIKSKLLASKRCIMRLQLSKKGKFSIENFVMKPESCNPVVVISNSVLDSENMLLRHKTTYRPWYDQAMKRIKKGEVWDEIFMNERGEVCEGARSNIFVKMNGVLYTSPIDCGILPGILRADLLKRKKCVEKVLMLKDLGSADAVFCGNSVRGLVRVKVKTF